MPATQHITASITISGQQDIALTSHDRGAGSYVAVTTGLVMITVFDLAAARTYSGAWLAPHLLDFARLLPSDGTTDWRNERDAASAHLYPTAATGPALSIEAHGSNDVKRNFDRNRQVMLVKVGDILWTVADVEAYRSMNAGVHPGREARKNWYCTTRPHPPGKPPQPGGPLPPRDAGCPAPGRRPVENSGGRAGLPSAVRAPAAVSPGRRGHPPPSWSPAPVVHSPRK